MKINKFNLGQLQTNCYFIEINNDLIIIDPADSADFLSEKILEKKLNFKGIIISHGHFDHILAAGTLQKIFNCPIYLNKKDEFLIKTMNQSNKHWTKNNVEYLEPQKITNIKENDIVLDFKVIETPGHTPGGVCLYNQKNNILISGDTLFKGAIGRYDFSYSSKNLLKESLNKLMLLPDNTIVYPGHGEETLIKYEKKT